MRIQTLMSKSLSWDIAWSDVIKQTSDFGETRPAHKARRLFWRRLLVSTISNTTSCCLATHPSADIWWFSVSRADEAGESHFLISPSGTLLVWIDNYFDPIAANGQTTFGRYRNLTEYYSDWLDKPDENGLVDFSNQAGPRFKRIHRYRASMKDPKRPKEHGDFDNPLVFETILCYVDPTAFQNPTSCPPSPTMFSSSLKVPQ